MLSEITGRSVRIQSYNVLSSLCKSLPHIYPVETILIPQDINSMNLFHTS